MSASIPRWVTYVVIATTLIGVFILSIFEQPFMGFGMISLGVIILLLFGNEMGRVTFKAAGMETIIERAEQAEKGALDAANQANEAVASAQRSIALLEQRHAELMTEFRDLQRDALVITHRPAKESESEG